MGSSPIRGTINFNIKIMWLKESNRQKHFLYAIPIGFVFTILCVIGIALGLEFKDKQYGNKFDYLDILATLLGGIIGQILQVVLILIIK